MTFQAFTKTITAALCGAALATAVSAQEDAVLTVTAGDMEHTYTMEQLKELPSSRCSDLRMMPSLARSRACAGTPRPSAASSVRK